MCHNIASAGYLRSLAAAAFAVAFLSGSVVSAAPPGGSNGVGVAGVKLGQSRTYAFLVGCGAYDRRELRPLEFTLNDVQALHKTLIDSGVPQENVVLMHDNQSRNLLPESKKIREQFDLLLARVDKQSTFIVALSGHGIQFDSKGTNYFCPLDARLQEPETLIPLDEIYKQLEGCPAERKLLLVDACRNDPQSSLAKSRAVVELKTLSRPQDEVVPKGIVALFSCSAGQQSYEHPNLKHGVFFHQLLQGWKGAADANKDRAVTLDEVLSYTKLKTEAFAHLELGSKQIPHLKGDFSGTWILREMPPLAAALGPAGRWRIAQAANLDGSRYGGNVEIRVQPSGLVQLTWFDKQGKTAQSGLGFVQDGHLLAAHSFGPGFGINLYKIGQDGTLSARWTSSGDQGKLFTEVARGTPGKLEGQYTTRGDANVGEQGQYSGQMSIARYGETYYVGYRQHDGVEFHGIGLRHGDWLVVGWSSTKNQSGFGVIDYALEGNSAQGRWTAFGTDKLTFEILERDGQ
jgi:hypothetical protein